MHCSRMPEAAKTRRSCRGTGRWCWRLERLLRASTRQCLLGPGGAARGWCRICHGGLASLCRRKHNWHFSRRFHLASSIASWEQSIRISRKHSSATFRCGNGPLCTVCRDAGRPLSSPAGRLHEDLALALQVRERDRAVEALAAKEDTCCPLPGVCRGSQWSTGHLLSQRPLVGRGSAAGGADSWLRRIYRDVRLRAVTAAPLVREIAIQRSSPRFTGSPHVGASHGGSRHSQAGHDQPL
mmetsp:Transcript_4835/g.11357  ORF Transcript_4835/g.11357 Transcript_4835/m.11357 type:complete len:240 (+) Transcript_4835:462-1181(+)